MVAQLLNSLGCTILHHLYQKDLIAIMINSIYLKFYHNIIFYNMLNYINLQK